MLPLMSSAAFKSVAFLEPDVPKELQQFIDFYVQNTYNLEGIRRRERMTMMVRLTDPVDGPEKLRFYLQSFYERANNLIRISIARQFLYEASEYASSYENEIHEALNETNERAELRAAVCYFARTLGVKLDRKREIQPVYPPPPSYINRIRN